MRHFVRAVPRYLCSAMMIFLLTPGSWGADKLWEFSAVPSITSGDYGTGINTTAVYLPFTIQRLLKNGDIGLTVPFESITGNGAVTFQGGVPNRTGEMGGTGGGSNSTSGALAIPQMMSGEPNDAGRFTGSSNRTTNSGLGDIVVRGRYDFLKEGDWAPSVDLTSRVKVPTASRDKGLGTGKFDEGFGAEFFKEIVGPVSATTSAGYTFVGRSSGEDLRDVWDYSVGLGYDITDALKVGLAYEEARSLISGDSNPEDIEGSLKYRLTEDWKITGSILAGLSKGSPDFGFSLGLLRKF